MKKTIIDLTHTITDTMPVHPLDEPVSLEKTRTLSKEQYNDWTLSMGMHVGTHIDGPGHLTNSPLQLSEVPLEMFIGKGILVDARNSLINATLFKNLPTTKEPSIVLIWTGMDKQFGSPDYFSNHPVITIDGAQELSKHNVKMVGIDFFSPDAYPFPVHHLLFAHKILIIENLTNLGKLAGIEDFTVMALPLKTATDSALARVIAIVD